MSFRDCVYSSCFCYVVVVVGLWLLLYPALICSCAVRLPIRLDVYVFECCYVSIACVADVSHLLLIMCVLECC